MEKQRTLLVYFLIFQMLLVALGVPVFVRYCQMPDMKREISFFSKKDNCCENIRKNKNHKKNNQNSCKKTKSKPLNPCCTFQSEIWQADIEQTTNADISILPVFLFLFILPNVFKKFLHYLKIFFGFFLKKNKLFGFCYPPPLPKIPNWLRFKKIIR